MTVPVSIPIAAVAALLLAAAIADMASANAATEGPLQAVEQAREAAEAAEADLLAPTAYADAIAALNRARRAVERGAAAEAQARQIEQASAGFAAARRDADAARKALEAPLARREAARAAEAYRLAGSIWVQGEEQLKSAARRLEKADPGGAAKDGEAAGRLFDAAELQAIKAGLLADARRLVAQLDGAGTARLAPKTTARAQAELQRAEATLDADRTRTAEAGVIAGAAAAEARHAVALSQYLKAARDSDVTSEDLVLAWESGLTATAAAAGTVADLSAGPPQATEAVTLAVSDLAALSRGQAQELRQREQDIAALDEQVRGLDSRLAGASNEARNLSEQLEVRERARLQFRRIEQAFSADQAAVLRQGKDIIVRLQGLAFPTGSAKLAASATPTLEKLRDVLAVYPGALYSVEGHTDSSGDSAANQRLSQSRADAVRAYIVQRLQVPSGRVTAVGYGDSRPIASNESEEGRRQNRRIDLVITPRDDEPPP